MFSKAKRFEPIVPVKTPASIPMKPEVEILKAKVKVPSLLGKAKLKPPSTPIANSDIASQTSSVKSSKSFTVPKSTPKPVTKITSSVKKLYLPPNKTPAKSKCVSHDDIMTAQEVEIRNKDFTISEYNKQIDELKNEIANLRQQIKTAGKSNDLDNLDNELSKVTLSDTKLDDVEVRQYYETITNGFNKKVLELEQQCEQLEQEVSSKQVELTSLEEIIIIRDSLCTDLQDKLTSMETCLEETKQRLEMVKGHHALALEANESIRREYKAELETLKSKFEEEKQSLISKSKSDQEIIKSTYMDMIETIKAQLVSEKDETVGELQQQLATKDAEMKAKLEQIDEATHEKLRLCEIQFEERSRNIQDEWARQQAQIQYLEKESKDLKYSLNITEEQNMNLLKEINCLKTEITTLNNKKTDLQKETDDLKEESKKKLIDFENQINRLTVEVDKAIKEKNKFEMSLSVTRDIVQVLTLRLRESDNELEHLENQVQSLADTKESLENELATYKNTLNNTVLECSEYKEALVNILKSKAALAKEHTRIMEHNVTLIESLQNVEKEAYRELGSIKNELIEDVEMLKKESNSQILILREEVEKKRMLCELATEHAGHASAAAEQSRVLLSQAANEIARLEADNQRLQQQIEDQQSLVVELSLLRQENEELTMTMAKQASLVEKMKKDSDHIQSKPKSPSVMRKSHKTGKENLHVMVSPLRERNH